MLELKIEDEFRLILNNKEQLIVFIFHNWSEPSHMAKKVIEEWEKESERQIYLLDASFIYLEKEDYLYQWLYEQEKGDWSKEGIMTINRYSPRSRVHAYGETIWISNQRVIGFEGVFGSFNSDELEERTKELFKENKNRK